MLLASVGKLAIGKTEVFCKECLYPFNVHSDYGVYATELINFLSSIITTRVKNEIVKKELNKKYSCKQIFRMLSKYKKVRIDKDAPWEDVTRLKYIEELTKSLDV